MRDKVVTVLRKARISEDQIGLFLGHRRADTRITMRYGEFDPAYMQDAADAIDAWIARLAKHTARPLVPPDDTRKTPALTFTGKTLRRPPSEPNFNDFSNLSPGGRCRDRTCGPYHVKVVLFR